MTKERIRSKSEKLEEMLQTKAVLERRIAGQKEKELKRQKQNEIADAKAAAKEKIASEIAANASARDDQKLEKAAEALGANKEPAPEEVVDAVTPVVEKAKVDENPIVTMVKEKVVPAVETIKETIVGTETAETTGDSELAEVVKNGAAVTVITNEMSDEKKEA